MKPFERAALRSSWGRKLRPILAMAGSPSPATVSELRGAIGAAGILPNSETADAIIAKARELAGRATAAESSPFTMNQVIDQATVGIVREIHKGDSLLPTEHLPGEVEDMSAAEADDLADRIHAGDQSPEATEARRADARQAAELTRLGFQRRT